MRFRTRWVGCCCWEASRRASSSKSRSLSSSARSSEPSLRRCSPQARTVRARPPSPRRISPLASRQSGTSPRFPPSSTPRPIISFGTGSTRARSPRRPRRRRWPRRRCRPDRTTHAAGSSPAAPSLFLRDHVGHEELLAVVVEGERIVIVVHPPHLHAPQAELDLRLADLDLAQVQDAVGEEVLPPLGETRRAERRLRDQERREAELLEG